MVYVRQLGWEVVASSEYADQKAAQVAVTIFRDGQPITTLKVEPGNTPRLSRGESTFYFWTFSDNEPDPNRPVAPDAADSAGDGEPPQDFVEFANGIAGHLQCRFAIQGDDLWKRNQIMGYVRCLHREGIPGTHDTYAWVPDEDWTALGIFGADAIVSSDSADGVHTWTLLY